MPNPTLPEHEKAIRDLKGCARMEDLFWLLVLVFLLLGIISDALNVTLGLETIHWFLLTITALLAAIFSRMGRAIYWYLINTK